MLERILAFVFTLIERFRPHTIDLGDDMDSLPYIPDRPEDVEAVDPHEGARLAAEDQDASNPARKGV